MLNGNTASLTPKCGIIFRVKFRSFSVLPSMICVANRAIGILQTLLTNGTVRLARGFASNTYTTSFAIAYWTLIKPTT